MLAEFRFSPRLILAAAATALVAPIVAFSAVATAQELHITSRGEARLVGAELYSQHALNLYTVRIWGQRWIVRTDAGTTFEAADGAAVKAEDVHEGHALDITGSPTEDTGTIAATRIRDLSINPVPPPPPPSAGSASVLNAAKPAAKPPPVKPKKKTTLATSTPSGVPLPPLPTTGGVLNPSSRLTAELRSGAKGGEVIILQRFLQKRGYGIPDDGPVTGNFGLVTRRALINFQRAKELELTGVTDAPTRAAINAVLDGGQ